MAIKPVLRIPHPVLYKVSPEVVTFDRHLRDLVRDMFDSMYAASGVGLAAVQIGVLQRVIVLDLSENGFGKGVYVNPRLVEQSEEEQTGDEGCLSVPGLSLPLNRPKRVKVAYQNISGQKQLIEGDMLLARALLHEMDHLDGKVFIDRVLPEVRQKAEGDIQLIAQGKKPQHSREPEYRDRVRKERSN